MNHVEILPELVLLTKYAVATSLLRLHYLPADNPWAFDYYEKHSPKVVLTKSKKDVPAILLCPYRLGYRNAIYNKLTGGIIGHSRIATLQPANPLETT